MNDQHPTIKLAQELINRPSITPDDQGCQEILIERLNKSGFTCKQLKFAEVTNLWAKRGDDSPLFVFVGHTDVVPTGPLDQWHTPPFEATIKDNLLCGRGAADMKGSLAAMLVAYENFVAEHPQHQGALGFLITSDEEGPSVNGTRKVVDYLLEQQEKFDYCLVGEPSSAKVFGDTIKIGRRGSLSGNLVIHGKQGHIAYPENADNPIHRALPALLELTNIQWDEDSDNFQATRLQISNLNSGTGAGNVIPGDLKLQFNLRYSPVSNVDTIKKTIIDILNRYNLNFQLEWHHSGQPFLTKPSKLINASMRAIKKHTGITPSPSTNGGTSDGRFFAKTGCQIVEFGPLNSTIHQLNEHTNVDDLINLTKIYQTILEELLLN